VFNFRRRNLKIENNKENIRSIQQKILVISRLLTCTLGQQLYQNLDESKIIARKNDHALLFVFVFLAWSVATFLAGRSKWVRHVWAPGDLLGHSNSGVASLEQPSFLSPWRTLHRTYVRGRETKRLEWIFRFLWNEHPATVLQRKGFFASYDPNAHRRFLSSILRFLWFSSKNSPIQTRPKWFMRTELIR
jgi:hypothetical protein